MHIQASWNVVS